MVTIPLRVQSAVAGLVVAGGILFWSDLDPSDRSSGATAPTSSASPRSALSLADFCYDFVSMRTVFDDMTKADPEPGVGARIRRHAEAILAAGPPAEMPPEAQSGFRLLMTSMTTLPDDATMKDLTALDEVLALGDTSGAEAFNQYAAENCLGP